jgi:hypothetical protein
MSTARFRIALGAILLLAVAAGTAQAQEFRGRVQGIVADTTGAVVPGVGVVLRNDNTGVEVSRSTNKDGWYLFDYVDPGTYTLSAALSGFKTELRKGVRVQQRADLTVDFKLEVGSLVETVSVTEAPLGLQFTTATRDLTVEQEMVKELPSSTRNPFQLAMLDPMTVNRGSTVETQPYHHRTANEMDIGGGTKYRNDVLLDGTPLTAGNKLGYTPPMDAVTEYTVLQNAIDAEFGHNSGGVAVVTMKSGSNDIHATAYYYGRDASLNAISDRAIQTHSDNPYWNAGATLGLPIVKNKLFLFAVFEKIENTQSSAGYYTLPSALERQGDFSQSKNADGSLRVIYDPATSRYGPNGELIRDPFPGNKIPRDRWDPLAAKLLGGLWNPNNAGDDKSGFNNFKYQQELKFHYYNFSTRLDWNINDRWKAYARVSRMVTNQDGNDYTDGNDPLKLRNITGSKRNGWNIAADTVYTFNPTTTLNLRGSFYQAEDKRDYPDMAIGEDGMQGLWPSGWWQSYATDRPLIYSPYIVVDSAARAQFGVQNFWYQAPRGYSLHARLSKYLTRHTLKAGTEIRWKRGEAARYYFTQFQFVSRDTANAWSSPNTKTGSPWASFLLGALDSQTPSTGGAANSRVQYTPPQTANTEMYGFYVQDDFRVTRDVTLNIGLRYEYEGGLWDPQNRLPQRLDLNDPIPGMQQTIDPKMPAQAREMMAQSAGQKTYSYNGAFYFTEDGNKRKTNAWKYGFMPRIGLAWRFGEKTVARAGYGRFVTPTSLANSERDTLGEIDLSAFSPITSALPNKDGVPAAYLDDPFPQGLTPPYGKTYGRYTSLGDTLTIDEYNQRTPISDRINVSVQRELPFRLIVDATYLINFISHDQYSRNLNMQDPRLQYTYKENYGKSVTNPFYNYGTEATFPGALRRQKTVPTSQLLRPYPQYGDIIQTGTDERKARYQSFQLRLQRPFQNGFSFLVSYAYVKTESQWYFDPVDEYDGKLTWMPFSVTQAGRTGAPVVFSDPAHRLAAAATVELPVGRNHRFGSNMPAVLDAIVGGWQISGVFTYQAGAPLIFTNAMVAPDTVTQTGDVGSDKFWFDTTGFARQPAYTRRTNPWTYDGLNGPSFKNLDLTLSKRFKLVGRAKLQLRLDAFNALNGMNWANPTLDVTRSDFGRTNAQAVGYYGRQLQYSARIEF